MSGHYDRSHSSWQYEDGFGRMRARHSQESWSSHGSTPTTMTGPSRPALQQPPPQFDIHQQIHAAAMSHHQTALSHHERVMQQFRQDQPLFRHDQQSLQDRRNSTSLQIQVPLRPAPSTRLTIEHVVPVESSSEEESEGESSVENDHTNLPAVSQQRQWVPPPGWEYQAGPEQHLERVRQRVREEVLANERQRIQAQGAAQRQALEERYMIDQSEQRRQSTLMDERMRKLEDKETKGRAEREAIDLEMRQLRDENLRLTKQSNEEAQRHEREMGDLARLYAAKPQQETVFDMLALQKLIQEVQSQQLSRADIDQIIQSRVAHQLTGVAKQKDLDAAGSRMEKALSQLPRGVSAEQVRDAVNQELGKAVNTLSQRMQTEFPKLEDTQASAPGQLMLPDFAQRKRSHNLVAVQPQSQASMAVMRKTPGNTTSKELDQAPLTRNGRSLLGYLQSCTSGTTCSPEDTDRPTEPIARPLAGDTSLIKVKKSRKGKEKGETATVQDQATSNSAAGDTSLTKVKKSEKGKEKAETATVQDSATTNSAAGDTSLTKVKKSKKGKEKADTATVQDPGASSSAHAQPLSIHAAPMDIVPLSHVELLPLHHDGKRTVMTPIIMLPNHAALCGSSQTSVRFAPLQQSGPSQTSIPFATLQHYDTMSKTSGNERTALPDDFPENASQITSWERSKSSKKSPSALSNIEESSPADQSLVKKSKHGKGRLASISDVFARGSKALAKGDRSASGIPSSISDALPPNMINSLELPADFPENASQISTWERQRSSTIVPLISGATPPAQIEAASGSMPGQELVRPSKPKKKGTEEATGVMPDQELARSGKSKKHDSK